MKKYYALKDTAMGVFLNPFVATTDAEAIRTATDWVNDPEGKLPLNYHPEHYSLYHLTDFDDETGQYYQEDGKLPKELMQCQSMDKGEKKYTIKQLAKELKEALRQ